MQLLYQVSQASQQVNSCAFVQTTLSRQVSQIAMCMQGRKFSLDLVNQVSTSTAVCLPA